MRTCVCQKTGELLYQLYQSPVPLCAAEPHLYTAQVNLYAAQAHLYDVQANLRAPPVRLLSDSPGQACKSANGEKAPGRTGRHANRDKDQSNVSTYGKQPPDKYRVNRVGQVQYAHRYGFQKSSYLIFMCYISSKIDINHDIIKDIYVNNRLKQTSIDSNSPKVTNAYTGNITFVLLSSTS